MTANIKHQRSGINQEGVITPQVTPHDSPQVTPQVERLLLALEGAMSRDDLMDKLKLRDRTNFMEGYINPALELNLIAMTIPDKPRSRLQKYRLTAQGEKAMKASEEGEE